jgi:hypothetical protein
MKVIYSVERRGSPQEWQVVEYAGEPGGEVVATCSKERSAFLIAGLLQSSVDLQKDS